MITLKYFLTCITIGSSPLMFGQVTTPSNAPISGNYVGFDATSTETLPIRNDGNQAIEFHTNGTLRMTIANNIGNFGVNTAPVNFAKIRVGQNTPLGIEFTAASNQPDVAGARFNIGSATAAKRLP